MIKSNILKIASNTKFMGLKNVFTHKSSLKNKICGDIIKIEVVNKKNKIALMRYEIEACIFCQASASALSNKISTFSKENLYKDIKDLEKHFKDKKIKLPKKFRHFKNLIDYRNINRYDCIMLPFRALIKALKIQL